MLKPKRHIHIWEDDSTHRAVGGKEYDEVWDYATALETALKDAMEQSRASQKVLLIEQQKHIDTANWAAEQQERADTAENKVRKLEADNETLLDALEHCGYDPEDCIDCGGPPHDEHCRFWKLKHLLSYWEAHDAK